MGKKIFLFSILILLMLFFIFIYSFSSTENSTDSISSFPTSFYYAASSEYSTSSSDIETIAYLTPENLKELMEDYRFLSFGGIAYDISQDLGEDALSLFPNYKSDVITSEFGISVKEGEDSIFKISYAICPYRSSDGYHWSGDFIYDGDGVYSGNLQLYEDGVPSGELCPASFLVKYFPDHKPDGHDSLQVSILLFESHDFTPFSELLNKNLGYAGWSIFCWA